MQLAGSAVLVESMLAAVCTDRAEQLASGALELPVAATFPLDRVVDAFEQLERQHTPVEVVLVP